MESIFLQTALEFWKSDAADEASAHISMEQSNIYCCVYPSRARYSNDVRRTATPPSCRIYRHNTTIARADNSIFNDEPYTATTRCARLNRFIVLIIIWCVYLLLNICIMRMESQNKRRAVRYTVWWTFTRLSSALWRTVLMLYWYAFNQITFINCDPLCDTELMDATCVRCVLRITRMILCRLL